MIHWGWLIAAYTAGVIFGMTVFAFADVSQDRETRIKSRKDNQRKKIE